MSPSPINSYIVKVASRCNLDCTYCYEYHMGDETWRSMPAFMSPETVSVLVRRIGEHCARHGVDEIYVNLHGGEPLLYGCARTRALLDAFARGLPGVRVHWGIQTNGILLDEAWVELFDAFGFHLGLSVDGPAPVNDRYRLTHAGAGSHAAVMAGVRHLATSPGRRIFAGCLTVIDPDSDPLAVYEHLLDLGARSVDFLLPHGNWDVAPPRKGPRPMDSTPFADWLIPIFDTWFVRDSERIQIRTFEEIIEHLAGGPGRLETLGTQPVSLVVVAANGDIEGVDTLKSIPGQHELGLNVRDHDFDRALAHPKVALRQEGLGALCETCRACPLVATCGGGYLPHRWSSTAMFRNPSVFCADLAKTIRHVHARVVEQVRSGRAPGAAGPPC